jgi:hypothetical protein
MVTERVAARPSLRRRGSLDAFGGAPSAQLLTVSSRMPHQFVLLFSVSTILM